MRVLVTGADGFLGRVLAMRLRDAGKDVITLGRGSSAAIRADLTDRAQVIAALRGVEVNAVCHLAARINVRESFTDPLGYYAVNLGGTLNLLEAVTAPRFVLLSTASVYGSRHTGPLDETLTPRPENPYAASKLAAESLVASVAQAGSIAATILRCFNIGGAYAGVHNPNPAGIIPAALRAAAGEIPHVAINGDGSAIREFIHVIDVADAIIVGLTQSTPGVEILNVGTGLGFTMLEVVAMVSKVTGRQIEVVHRPALNEAPSVLADTGRIRSRLGWAPAHSDLEQIVRDSWTFP